MNRMWYVVLGWVLFALVGMAGCSSTPDYKGVYKAEQEETSLDVPPGLDTPQTDTDLSLPEQQERVRTYSGYSDTVLRKPKDSMIETYEDMRFVRDGALFWLEVDAPPGQVWNDVHDFFRSVGFEIENDYPQLGMMETNWKENRVNVPANWFGSLFSAVYTSELRDKYRIRVEPTEQREKTRVFVAHQGVKEIAVQQADAGPEDPTVTDWVPRESDPELEVEMLMRFMAYRGLPEEKAQEQIARAGDEIQRTQFKTGDEAPVLQINEPFDRAWRHVGLALDRLGFFVEDQNRAAGVYYVRLPEYLKVEEEKGWFASLFGGDESAPKETQYLLIVKGAGNASEVQVRSRGDMEPAQLSKVAAAILKRIQENIL